ncbi:phosphoribosylformimino-5-aminoimidazole carboxamide ribotide isomerase [Lachnospiraceae bacterium OttesenSCG-928-J05]|nr:phosphoribosylformimino-5-aminoimidazole carboxamide ribotide isomerase [Lachnospiraceae bacterium OttesenSCG-928-J05]
MKFRPCIDIHDGKVKQIVGGSLTEAEVKENFASDKGAAFYAELYKKDHLLGGHVIMLNKVGSEAYEKSKKEALNALRTYPGGLQIGGGLNAENAQEYLEAGAKGLIFTSYVFQEGRIRYDRLEKLVKNYGREQIVLDLSCRRKGDSYYIVTDRWQQYTEEKVSASLLKKLAGYCQEYLVHGVDVEGTGVGMEANLVAELAKYHGNPITYAGGLASFEEIERFRELSSGRLDFTVGSALDIFGGTLSYEGVKSV